MPLHALHIGKSAFAGADGGGSDRVFEALLDHLPQHGVEAEGVVVGASQRPAIVGVSRTDAALPRRLWSVRNALTAKMTNPTPDVVASHFALYTLPVLDRLARIPLIVHFHGPWALESAAEGAAPWAVRLKKQLELLVYRRAARFIVLSRAFRDVLHTRYGAPMDRICIVPGGVDTERFHVSLSREQARARLGWADRPTVLVVRRLAQRMGLEQLIDATHLARKQAPELQVLIGGKGPLSAALQQRIEAQDLADSVRLLGFIPDEDLPLAYRAADATMVPTQALEGFGLITLESLAAGTPVLVTPVGGLPETVDGLDPSLILSSKTVQAIADGLLGVVESRYAHLTPDVCRSYVQQNFAWPVIARQIAEVYREVTR